MTKIVLLRNFLMGRNVVVASVDFAAALHIVVDTLPIFSDQDEM